MEEKGKKRGVSMERSKVGTKNEVPIEGLSLPIQNTILIIVNKIYYFIRYKKNAIKFK